MNQDAEHLRLLSIFHYVVAGLTALFACFPVMHLVMGLFLIFAPDFMFHQNHMAHNPEMDAVMTRVVGCFLVTIATLIILAGWTLACCLFLAGRCLNQHRRYTFCLVIAAISCMMVPFGTVLGVLTIIVLMRPSVKALFEPPTQAETVAEGQNAVS
jgi:hypothetical protein